MSFRAELLILGVLAVVAVVHVVVALIFMMQMRNVLEWLGAIHNGLERIAVELERLNMQS